MVYDWVYHIKGGYNPWYFATCKLVINQSINHSTHKKRNNRKPFMVLPCFATNDKGLSCQVSLQSKKWQASHLQSWAYPNPSPDSSEGTIAPIGWCCQCILMMSYVDLSLKSARLAMIDVSMLFVLWSLNMWYHLMISYVDFFDDLVNLVKLGSPMINASFNFENTESLTVTPSGAWMDSKEWLTSCRLDAKKGTGGWCWRSSQCGNESTMMPLTLMRRYEKA